MDINNELYEQILDVINLLMHINPEKDSPAGELLIKFAKALSEYEDNFFKFERIMTDDTEESSRL